MSKKIVVFDDKNGVQRFDDFSVLFQTFAKENEFVKSVEDGVIVLTKNKTEREVTFGYLEVEGIKDEFVSDITEYRDRLRISVKEVMQQIGISKPELEKLKNQFEFLTEDSDSKPLKVEKEEPTKEVEETKEENDDEDEIPV